MLNRLKKLVLRVILVFCMVLPLGEGSIAVSEGHLIGGAIALVVSILFTILLSISQIGDILTDQLKCVDSTFLKSDLKDDKGKKKASKVLILSIMYIPFGLGIGFAGLLKERVTVAIIGFGAYIFAAMIVQATLICLVVNRRFTVFHKVASQESDLKTQNNS